MSKQYQEYQSQEPGPPHGDLPPAAYPVGDAGHDSGDPVPAPGQDLADTRFKWGIIVLVVATVVSVGLGWMAAQYLGNKLRSSGAERLARQGASSLFDDAGDEPDQQTSRFTPPARETEPSNVSPPVHVLEIAPPEAVPEPAPTTAVQETPPPPAPLKIVSEAPAVPAPPLPPPPGGHVTPSMPIEPPQPDDSFTLQLKRPGEAMDLNRHVTPPPVDAVAPASPSRPMDRPAPTTYTDFGRALAFQRAGDYPRAIEFYQKALEQNPGHFGCYNNLGVLYQQMGEHARAIDTLKQALVLRPDDASVHANLANSFMALGRHDDTIRALHEAIRLDPNHLAASTNLGITYMSMNKFIEARSVLESAAAAHPDEPRVHLNLGNLYRRMRDTEKAISSYLRFLELSGGQYPAQEAQVRTLLGNTGSW